VVPSKEENNRLERVSFQHIRRILAARVSKNNLHKVMILPEEEDLTLEVEVEDFGANVLVVIRILVIDHMSVQIIPQQAKEVHMLPKARKK